MPSWASRRPTSCWCIWPAVLLIARYTHGPGYALAASVLATFAFNYFFTEPRFTFGVSDTGYLITFAIMTFTAVFTSTLTAG